MSDSESDDSPDYIPDEFQKEIPTEEKLISSQRKKSRSSLTQKSSPNFSSNWSHHIPYEILLKIFIYYGYNAHGDLKSFKILQDVCQYWKNVASDSKLWFNINLSLTLQAVNKPVEAGKLKKLNSFLKSAIELDSFKYCETMNLSDLPHLTHDHLSRILSACSEKVLDHLDLSHCKKIQKGENSSYEKLIVEKCSNLKWLNLSGMKVSLSEILCS